MNEIPTREICGRCERPKAKPFSHVETGECAVDVAQPLHGANMTAQRLACFETYADKLVARLQDLGCPCQITAPCMHKCSCAYPVDERRLPPMRALWFVAPTQGFSGERIARSLAFTHGVDNCIQDGCENAPFASVGGLAARTAMVAPKYAPPGQESEYLRGYATQARAEHGVDWQTCSFGWAPAVTIGVEG